MEGFDARFALPLLGVVAGIVLGYVARVDRFCTLSALERYWYAGDGTGVRTWALAAASALIATQALVLTGLIDISQSFYLDAGFGLTGAVFGGLMFGFGMALVGTCGFGAVVRLGGGSLRSLIVLIVIGLAALATQRGLVGLARIQVVDNLALDLSFAGDQSLGSIASALVGADLHAAVALLAAGGLLAWIFKDAGYRRRPRKIVTGTLIGLVIAFGWVATVMVAERSFEPVQLEAGSFVVPVGDLLMQIITFTGALPDYGVGLIVGTLIGAAIGAWRKHDTRWEACDDARELSRHLSGAALMGIGGVFAMGCTVGQGITAVSTLAISAPVVIASIALGARLGLAWLLEGSPLAPFRRTHTGAAAE
jgi:uncharacterized protein